MMILHSGQFMARCLGWSYESPLNRSDAVSGFFMYVETRHQRELADTSHLAKCSNRNLRKPGMQENGILLSSRFPGFLRGLFCCMIVIEILLMQTAKLIRRFYLSMRMHPDVTE